DVVVHAPTGGALRGATPHLDGDVLGGGVDVLEYLMHQRAESRTVRESVHQRRGPRFSVRGDHRLRVRWIDGLVLDEPVLRFTARGDERGTGVTVRSRHDRRIRSTAP